ncbi:MAG: hypothetical protein LBU16_04300 [Treponema sp.]|nr:hypothetical protein [Treponema sp.]
MAVTNGANPYFSAGGTYWNKTNGWTTVLYPSGRSVKFVNGQFVVLPLSDTTAIHTLTDWSN